jgi:tRNA dimethylallyltransferase
MSVRRHRGVILLMGPTGSGKSALAIRLAEQLPLELVSVDSAMVYRGMDIGTAKPDASLRRRIPHHLIDIRDPMERYSAGEFVRDALEVVQGIWARERTPLLVGGTMLYFHALTQGIAPLPKADAAVRAGIDAEAAQSGWAALHAQLSNVDPAAARRIHVNDPQRIQRALEVYRLTGASITSLQQPRLSAFADAQVIQFALAPLERRELHTRIRDRFMAMLDAGLLDEVRGFYARGDLTVEHPSMRAVGYRQLWRHLTGQIALGEATEQAVAATRQLAKRQFTWLRRRADAHWLDSMHPEVASLMLDALSKCGILVGA